MYNNKVDIEILKMFYNNYMDIDEIALKLDTNVDEIDKILSFYYNNFFYDIPYQFIIISDE